MSKLLTGGIYINIYFLQIQLHKHINKQQTQLLVKFAAVMSNRRRWLPAILMSWNKRPPLGSSSNFFFFVWGLKNKITRASPVLPRSLCASAFASVCRHLWRHATKEFSKWLTDLKESRLQEKQTPPAPQNLPLKKKLQKDRSGFKKEGAVAWEGWRRAAYGMASSEWCFWKCFDERAAAFWAPGEMPLLFCPQMQGDAKQANPSSIS